MGKCNHFALRLEKPYLFLGTLFSPVYIYLPSNLSQQSPCLEYTYPLSARTLSMCGRGRCEVSYNRTQTLTTTVTLCRAQTCGAELYVRMYVCMHTGRKKPCFTSHSLPSLIVNADLIGHMPLCVFTDDSSPAKDNCVDMCNCQY